MKIDKNSGINVSAELVEQYPYRPEWRQLAPAEMTPAETLLANMEHLQGVKLDDEACRAIQLSYDVLHQR